MHQVASLQRYEAAHAYLFSRIDYERQPAAHLDDHFKLRRMHDLLRLLGDPHFRLPVVHVAGTKGKGSTSAMIAAALRSAGYKVGLHTSPHLERLEERYWFDGALCSPDTLVDLVEQVRAAVERLDASRESGPTFFEITTAMAFVHFVARGADAAVIEVGLGGRLDSTNVCQPVASVITSISFDHMRQLGSTLAAIAGEKAGIIKLGVPVVSGVTAPEARRVIAARAAEMSAPLTEIDVHFSAAYTPPSPLAPGESPAALERWGGTVDFTRHDQPQRSLTGMSLGLPGAHQAQNAATACAVLQTLEDRGWTLGEAALRAGVATCYPPARIELLPGEPPVVIDVSHNVASVEALAATLAERFPARRMLLIFAASKDKDARGMLAALLPQCAAVIVTRFQHNPRSEEPAALVEALATHNSTAAGGAREIVATATPAEAWSAARRLARPGDIVCITGSFFLAAEMRPLVAGAQAAATPSLRPQVD